MSRAARANRRNRRLPRTEGGAAPLSRHLSLFIDNFARGTSVLSKSPEGRPHCLCQQENKRKAAPADRPGHCSPHLLVAIAVAVRPRPDQRVVHAFVIVRDQVGEDRSEEAGIVELDAEIFAAFLPGGPGPRGAQVNPGEVARLSGLDLA